MAGTGKLFLSGASVCWPNTNEKFTTAEFVRANSKYPGSWAASVEKVYREASAVVTMTKVDSREGMLSFRAVSRFTSPQKGAP